MRGWLHSVMSKPYTRKIFTQLTYDDEILSLTYELKNVLDKNNDDIDFVLELFAVGMVIEWLEPQVKSVLNTKQFFGGKEEKFYAQSTHINELRGLLKDTKLEYHKMIRDRGYILNSYINGV